MDSIEIYSFLSEYEGEALSFDTIQKVTSGALKRVLSVTFVDQIGKSTLDKDTKIEILYKVRKIADNQLIIDNALRYIQKLKKE